MFFARPTQESHTKLSNTNQMEDLRGDPTNADMKLYQTTGPDDDDRQDVYLKCCIIHTSQINR
jgi:hypothetical protein